MSTGKPLRGTPREIDPEALRIAAAAPRLRPDQLDRIHELITRSRAATEDTDAQAG